MDKNGATDRQAGKTRRKADRQDNRQTSGKDTEESGQERGNRQTSRKDMEESGQRRDNRQTSRKDMEESGQKRQEARKVTLYRQTDRRVSYIY